MLETITIDLETGIWEKKSWGFDGQDRSYVAEAQTRVWTDFTGHREAGSSEWRRFSQPFWDDTYTETGTADAKNIGTFGLLTSTRLLLTNGRFAIISHVRESYGWDPDPGTANDYTTSIR